jgi:hypothetical protein
VTVTNSLFTGNRVGRNSTGGGIYNQAGTVMVSGSTFVQNTAQAGAGIGGGGGFDIVHHSTVADNMGSGIDTVGGFVQLTDSMVADNVGSGIVSVYYQIERSTISGNFNPTGAGGGVVQNGCPGFGTIDNSTISDNTAFQGGGVDVGPTVGLCLDSVTITRSTIVDNHAVLGAVGQGGGGGIFIQGDIPNGFGSLFIGESIVAGNDSAIPFTGQDVDGPVTSLHSNFIGNGDLSDGWVTTGRDMDHVGTGADPLDPMLGALQDNGGPTLTRAPLPGSPVLTVFDTDRSPDQRGSFRVFAAPGAVAPNPATAFRIDAPPTVTSGQPFAITVTAVDQWGNTASTYHGTVHFKSTDVDAQLPDDYTFGAADGGAQTFDATLEEVGPQTILVQDTSTASLATAVSLFVDDGSGVMPVGLDSHHPRRV